MFIPKPFIMEEQADLHQFIEDFGFGIIVSDSLTATHLPFVLATHEGKNGVLYSHCAKANNHWKELHNKDVIVIFSGPHSYISPSWYAKNPAVPTWNYTAVHAYGEVTRLNDNETLKAVNDVVAKYEPNLLNEGKLNKSKEPVMPQAFKHKLLAGIVGFKIEITSMQGQRKLGQQRSLADQVGVYTALKQSKNINDQALAHYMKKINIGTGIS